MKRTLGWLILALSLLFNLFFTAGYLRARAQLSAAASGDGSPLVRRELGLDDRQAAVFSELRSSVEAEVAPYRAGIDLAEQELAAELRRDRPRLEELESIVSRRTELEGQRRLAGSRRFGAFVEVLSPEQRERLLGHMRLERRRQHMLERFDTNRDGALDDAERSAARERFEARRRARDEVLDELFDECDADGDGQLDRAEWETLRDRLRETMRRRGPRPDGGHGRPPAGRGPRGGDE